MNSVSEGVEKSPTSYVLALANRSAAHVRLGQWDEAEKDLSIILGNLDEYRRSNENVSDENCNGNHMLRHETFKDIVYPYGPHTAPAKLWERRANCLEPLQRHDEAKLCICICIKIIKGTRSFP